MNVDLTNPEWVGVVLTVLGAVITLTYAVTKLLLGRPNAPPAVNQLDEEQILTVLQIHQHSIASEVVKRFVTLFCLAHSRRRQIDSTAVEDLRNQFVTLVRERRELLRVFHTPAGRLDELLSRIYDPQIERDYQTLTTIASSNAPLPERAQRIEEEVRAIQLRLRQEVRHTLAVTLRGKT